MAEVERQAEQMPWGTPAEVTERIIDAAETPGADNVRISLNRGVLAPRNVHGTDPLLRPQRSPALRAHKVVRVPLAEEVVA